MRRIDGTEIKYLLERRGYSLSDVARQLGVTPQNIWMIIWGCGTSQRVIAHIETLLGMKPGTLRIAKRKRTNILKAA